MDADNKTVIDEEAIAEEEFVADLEDTIENPLVYDGEKITVQKKPEQLTVEEKEELTGAIGTGDLTPESEPFNNEEALRSESVNNDENPFGVDSGSEKAFGGPETAPLDNATETIAPSAAPEASSGDSFGVADTGVGTPGVTDFSASGPSATASTSEPTIEQLANAAAGASQTTEAPVDQTPVAATITPAANEPKKKSKKGLIIGIVVAVLLLAAIIGGVVFYILHESKDRVLADAISGIWSSDARQFDGKITMMPSDEAASASMKSITVNFKGDSKAANFSGSGDLSIEFKEGDPLNIGLSGAYISGDGIFVKIDKLEEAVKKINLGAVMGMDGDDDTADYAKLVEKVLAAVAKKIDGTWYKINADTFGSDEKTKEVYQCMTKAIEEMSSKEVKDKIADIYKAHPFIESADKDNESADGLTYYYVKVNEDESKAFGTDVKELNVFKDLQACSSSNGDMAPSSGSGTAEKKDEKAEADIKLGIKGWSHELKAIKGTVSYDKTKLEMDVKISYDNKDVTAPAGDATNIADAGEDLINAAADAYKEGYIEIAKKYCKSATTNDRDYKSCYDMMEKQLDRSLQSLLGGLGGNIINTSALLED